MASDGAADIRVERRRGCIAIWGRRSDRGGGRSLQICVGRELTEGRRPQSEGSKISKKGQADGELRTTRCPTRVEAKIMETKELDNQHKPREKKKKKDTTTRQQETDKKTKQKKKTHK